MLITKAHAADLCKELGYVYEELPVQICEDGRHVVVISARPEHEFYISRQELGRVGIETPVKAMRFGNSYQLGRDDGAGNYIPSTVLEEERDAARLSLIHCCVFEHCKEMRAGFLCTTMLLGEEG